MEKNTIQALNTALDAAARTAYIRTIDGKEFILDGDFTLEELEAIVLQIKTHNIHTPER